MRTANRVWSLFLTAALFSVLLSGCSPKDENVDVPSTLTAGIEEQPTHEEKVLLQQEIIRRQKLEMQRQDRELEDIERQKLYNDSLRRFEERTN